jgi:hypothetical protein
MARVSRLAGAILVETNGEFFLVGNTKMPCDWAAAGFEPPVALGEKPYVRLAQCGQVAHAAPRLSIAVEGEEIARRLAQRFVIERNGSVSDRLWRMVVSPEGDLDDEPPPDIDAAWLGEIPAPIWKVVRDTVLRCI